MRIRANDFFSIELEDQSEHTVSSGMLGTKVDSVVADLALIGALRVVRGDIEVLASAK